MRRQVKIRIGVVVLVVVAAVGAGVAWFVSADGGTDDAFPDVTDVPDSTEGDVVEPMELEAEVSIIDDEIWVFGGMAGPDGSEHPVPSSIPAGWEQNRSVVMYGSDGTMR